MADAFASHASSLEAPAAHAALVTPSDSTDLANVTRALLIGTSGTLKVTMAGGETVTLPANVVIAGTPLPLRVARVWSTGTGASEIFALW